MGILIDGKAIAKKINASSKRRAAALRHQGIVPKLMVVMVGDNKPSQLYVSRKQKIAQDVGVDFLVQTFPHDIRKAAFVQQLQELQTDPALSGIIVQLPLPDHLYSSEVLNTIRPELDVDFLTEMSLGRLLAKSNPLSPPTPSVTLDILRELKVNPRGKHAVIVGAGFLVGKPLAAMLMNEEATVTVCNVHTKHIAALCRQADILISCAGKKNLIKKNMVKRGAIVIDIGYSFQGGKYSGDVDVPKVATVARAVTPTPGGVGPITVAKLIQNVVQNAALLAAGKK